MTKKISTILCIIFAGICHAQLQTLNGKVLADGEVEGVHVLNKTSVKYTVTDTDGSFNILIKPNDTLVISALKYKLKEVTVSKLDIKKNNFRIQLEEKINALDEVTVGKILTGSLDSDVGNVELDDQVNFYDLGIPGYTGKPKTIEERKLFDADHGKMAAFYGIGAAVNINKLLNKISGRTKKLKEIVRLSQSNKCMNRLKDFYAESLFQKQELSKAQQAEYFYFCMDDSNFKNICEQNDPSEVIPFLNKKLTTYKANLNSNKN